MDKQIIKHAIRAKSIQAFLCRLEYIQSITAVDFHWAITDTTNYILWVDFEMTLTVTGNKDAIEAFRALI